ncbi:hypothetical protein Tco_1038083 [Tanacetum coccineum]
MVQDLTVGLEPVRCHQDCFSRALKYTTYLLLHRYARMRIQQRLVREQDELPSSVGLDFRARLDGGRIVEATNLTTSRLVNGLSCDGIDMVIKNLDLEPKVDAMMREFLE